VAAPPSKASAVRVQVPVMMKAMSLPRRNRVWQTDPTRLTALQPKAAELTVGPLWDRISNILAAFTSAECANYLRAAGYQSD